MIAAAERGIMAAVEGARMPSRSFNDWFADRAAALDEMESAHRYVRGTGQAVRATVQQINQAYVVMLSAQFQGFCRDFHSECVELFVAIAANPDFQELLRTNLTYGRRIDRGNPNSGNIGSDFGRLGLHFWSEIEAANPNNRGRRAALDELNEWRNPIAHQDFAVTMLRGGAPSLTLAQVRAWRRSCDGLVRSFDLVMRRQIERLTGVVPW